MKVKLVAYTDTEYKIVSDIPAGDGKSLTFFYSVLILSTRCRGWNTKGKYSE
jgi:hypothetical protein